MDHNDQPLISVIMPCHNAAPYISEAISSVLRQSHQHSEVIVVDDGSTDDSAAIVHELVAAHPARIKLFTQAKSGPYPARNRGLKEARGSYLAFLDADDWWRDDCLELLLAAIETRHADLAYCGWHDIGEFARSLRPCTPPAYEEQDLVAAFLRTCPWPIHAVLTKRSVMDEVNGFSERRFSSMDYDLWLRVLGHTRNIVRVPEVLAYYRWHGSNQISATKWRQVTDAMQVRRDFVSQYPDLVAHIPAAEIDDLIDGQLLKEAYYAHWDRDLENSQELFRLAFRQRRWRLRDLRYLLPALLPGPLFRGLARLSDRARPPARG